VNIIIHRASVNRLSCAAQHVQKSGDNDGFQFYGSCCSYFFIADTVYSISFRGENTELAAVLFRTFLAPKGPKNISKFPDRIWDWWCRFLAQRRFSWSWWSGGLCGGYGAYGDGCFIGGYGGGPYGGYGGYGGLQKSLAGSGYSKGQSGVGAQNQAAGYQAGAGHKGQIGVQNSQEYSGAEDAQKQNQQSSGYYGDEGGEKKKYEK
jgi:hypothetical protein